MQDRTHPKQAARLSIVVHTVLLASSHCPLQIRRAVEDRSCVAGQARHEEPARVRGHCGKRFLNISNRKTGGRQEWKATWSTLFITQPESEQSPCQGPWLFLYTILLKYIKNHSAQKAF